MKARVHIELFCTLRKIHQFFPHLERFGTNFNNSKHCVYELFNIVR